MQEPLQFSDTYLAHEDYKKILDACVVVANEVGRKQVAFDLGMSDKRLDNALGGRDRHRLNLEHLAYLMRLDRRGVIIRAMAECAGKEVCERRPLTAEEKLDRLQSALRRKLGELGAEIVEEALR